MGAQEQQKNNECNYKKKERKLENYLLRRTFSFSFLDRSNSDVVDDTRKTEQV